MKRALLAGLLVLADLVGLNRLFCRLYRFRVRVLMYHRVTPGPGPGCYWTVVDKARFRQQMNYVKKAYTVVPITVLVNPKGPQEANRVVITFDDGLRSTFEHAWPVLRELSMTGLCFVLPELSLKKLSIWADRIYACLMNASVQRVDLSECELGVITPGPDPAQRRTEIENLVEALKNMPHDARSRIVDHIIQDCPRDSASWAPSLALMSREQIVQLSKSDEFEIGGHTNTHPILSTMSPQDQLREIAGCLDLLQQWGVDAAPVFAYPNGRSRDFTDETVAVLRECGIAAAVTTVDGLHDTRDDPYRIRRIAIGADTGYYEFKARLSGLYYARRRLAGRGVSD